ncbi:MAG TPA: hypothetical protein VFQ53_22175 [Kofleriaceae bacterium]|nr:hypothetical protein [Kofleriaceae bacterium]
MDTNTRETDQKIEQAKASFSARAEELGRRISDVRQKLDIKGHIAAHPHLAVGAAFALGVVLGLVTGGGGHSKAKRGSRQDEATKRTIGGAIGGAISALLFAALKEAAVTYAKHYFAGGPGVATTGTEAAASRQPAVESFLEH